MKRIQFGPFNKVLELDLSLEIFFHNATDLWGCNIDEGQEKLDTQRSASLIIGPAGENLVSFANIASGSRFLGRGGMGAVMGTKNLKAIIALGGYYRIKPKNQPLFDKIKKKSMADINRNPMAIANRYYGTNANVTPVNKAGMLPVNDFSKGSHRSAPQISGEKIKEKHNTKYHTCKPCAIMCGHKGTFKNKETSVPEFGTIGLLGANLGIFDSDLISEWNDICSKFGMDTISAGETLGWVMEAGEKGLPMQYFPALAVRLVDFSLYTKTWTAVTGISISNSEFLKAGERVHVLERYRNTREGISKKDDTLPVRMFNEGRGCDPEGRTVPLGRMLKKYYKIRGFNQNGRPTKETLGKLKIKPAMASGIRMTPV